MAWQCDFPVISTSLSPFTLRFLPLQTCTCVFRTSVFHPFYLRFLYLHFQSPRSRGGFQPPETHHRRQWKAVYVGSVAARMTTTWDGGNCNKRIWYRHNVRQPIMKLSITQHAQRPASDSHYFGNKSLAARRMYIYNGCNIDEVWVKDEWHVIDRIATDAAAMILRRRPTNNAPLISCAS